MTEGSHEDPTGSVMEPKELSTITKLSNESTQSLPKESTQSYNDRWSTSDTDDHDPEKELAARPSHDGVRTIVLDEPSNADVPPKEEEDKVSRDEHPLPQSTIRDEPTPPPTLTKLAQKNPSPWDHLSITIGPPIIILFDIVIPIIIYYTWYNQHTSQWNMDCEQYRNRGEACPLTKPEFDDKILGYSIICFGFGELYILTARVWRLLKYRDECAPLLSRSKWELDATSWVYAVAMLMALIPFVVGSTMEIPKLFLYAPAFLMGFLGIIMVITLIPVKIPIGINSQARGTTLRPFMFYAAEDFIAVDGLQDREFRIRYNARYDSSKAFRRMFLCLTLWWIFGVMSYIGAVSVVVWTVEFHVAFGLSLGVLFTYIILWAIVSYLWVQIEMDRQKKAFESSKD